MTKPPQRVVYVVVRLYIWDKDLYIHAYLSRVNAELHRDRLNGEPYEIGGDQEYQVWTIPFC